MSNRRLQVHAIWVTNLRHVRLGSKLVEAYHIQVCVYVCVRVASDKRPKAQAAN